MHMYVCNIKYYVIGKLEKKNNENYLNICESHQPFKSN